MAAARTAYDLTLTVQLASKLDRPAAKAKMQSRQTLAALVLFTCTMLATLSYFMVPALMQAGETAGPTRTYVFHNGHFVGSFVDANTSTTSVASIGGGHAGLITAD